MKNMRLTIQHFMCLMFLLSNSHQTGFKFNSRIRS
jgi:hypothetical protein